MMFACWGHSAALEDAVKHLAVFHSFNIEKTPSGNVPVAFSSYLPAKQANNPILDAVIMWLGNSILAPVRKPNQPHIFDCCIKQTV